MTRLTEIKPLVPTREDVVLARHFSDQLSNYIKITKKPILQLVSEKKEQQNIFLPPIALKLLINILNEMGHGNAISLIPVHLELTTQQGADLLNVSRPFFINLLNEGKIPFRKVGTKRRILANEIIKYKTAVYKKSYKALEELTQQAQELKMGY